MKNFYPNYTDSLLLQQGDTEQSNPPVNIEGDKNMYEQYIGRTSGAIDNAKLKFGQSTNPSKSKFDNVVGWISLKK